MDLYGTRWFKVHGEALTEAWSDFLTGLTDVEQKRLFLICYERLELKREWPPEFGDFVARVRKRSNIELNHAYSRFVSKKPSGIVETYVYEEKSSLVKSARAGDEFVTFTNLINTFDDMHAAGALKTAKDDLKTLPVHNEMSLTDIAWNKFRESNAPNKFDLRIRNIIRSKGS